VITPKPLPESLRAGLDSPHPRIRIGAVTELGDWLASGDPARMATARLHLEEVADSDIPHVAHAARALSDTGTTAEPAVPAGTQTESVGSSKRPILDRATATRDAPALFRTVRKSQPLRAVAFSPDSRWLSLGDSVGFARLEEVTSGTEGLMVQHPGPVLGLAFSQDGRWLATMDEAGTARIWDAISGKEHLAIPSRGVEDVQMAFAPDGRRLATGGADGIARIWDASYGLEQLQVSEFWEEAGRAAHVNGLSFSPDGR